MEDLDRGHPDSRPIILDLLQTYNGEFEDVFPLADSPAADEVRAEVRRYEALMATIPDMPDL